MTPLVISIAVFVAVAALVGAAMTFWRGESGNKVEDRLDLLTSAKFGQGNDSGNVDVLSQPLDSASSIIEDWFVHFGNVRLFFEQADVKFTPKKFLGIIGAVAGCAMLLSMVGGGGLLMSPMLGMVAATLPVCWLFMRRKRRLKRFSVQLPDALELMGRALRSGHSLASGFNLVGSEMTEPISTEFTRVFEEQNLGIPLEEALDGMTDRVPNLDLKFFVTAVVLQRQTGGDLAEILDKIGRLVRERFRIWGQVQALTGEGRLSGIVLLALPPVLAVVVWRLNPDYLTLLFTDPMGRQLLAGAVVLQLLGAVAIRKIVNIKV